VDNGPLRCSGPLSTTTTVGNDIAHLKQVEFGTVKESTGRGLWTSPVTLIGIDGVHRMQPHVIVIGAGSTGAATAHDLAQRGYRVTVLERGEVANMTTGRNHCLLHSGGRYCVNDQESARECIDENMILRRIMPDALELNDGLFVALDDSDLAFKDQFLAGCEASHIPYRELSPRRALELEPLLNPAVKAAVQVPDGVFEPWRFCMAFVATARRNGAVVRTFTEVVGLRHSGSAVTGVEVLDHRTGQHETLGCDLIVNAAGPWAGEIVGMTGVDVPVVPTAGIMVTIGRRLNNMVVNRLNKPADGDIIVPQRTTSIIGTTSWKVLDPDQIDIPHEHIERMKAAGRELMPAVGETSLRGVGAAARPLIARQGEDERDVPRTFEVFDHARDGANGLFTISGGKTTTARGMAEKTVDLVDAKFGLKHECRTAVTPLLSYREFYN
jgi:glycerol-3-phosphate dehydrogenase